MRRLSPIVAAVAASLLVAPASAAVFDVKFDVYGTFEYEPDLHAIGTIETAGETGVYTLDDGITGFAAAGSLYFNFFAGGALSLAKSDLSFLTLTLQDGVVQGWSMATKTFAQPLQVFAHGPVIEIGYASFSVDWLPPSSFPPGSYPADNTTLTVSGSTSFPNTGRSHIVPSIPEPSTWALMAAGLSLAAIYMRRARPRA